MTTIKSNEINFVTNSEYNDHRLLDAYSQAAIDVVDQVVCFHSFHKRFFISVL